MPLQRGLPPPTFQVDKFLKQAFRNGECCTDTPDFGAFANDIGYRDNRDKMIHIVKQLAIQRGFRAVISTGKQENKIMLPVPQKRQELPPGLGLEESLLPLEVCVYVRAHRGRRRRHRRQARGPPRLLLLSLPAPLRPQPRPRLSPSASPRRPTRPSTSTAPAATTSSPSSSRKTCKTAFQAFREEKLERANDPNGEYHLNDSDNLFFERESFGETRFHLLDIKDQKTWFLVESPMEEAYGPYRSIKHELKSEEHQEQVNQEFFWPSFDDANIVLSKFRPST